MDCNVYILATAREEIDEITEQLLAQSNATAKRFLDSFEEAISLLESGVVDYALCPIADLAD
jgi:hypothetical protein